MREGSAPRSRGGGRPRHGPCSARKSQVIQEITTPTRTTGHMTILRKLQLSWLGGMNALGARKHQKRSFANPITEDRMHVRSHGELSRFARARLTDENVLAVELHRLEKYKGACPRRVSRRAACAQLRSPTCSLPGKLGVTLLLQRIPGRAAQSLRVLLHEQSFLVRSLHLTSLQLRLCESLFAGMTGRPS